MTSIVTPNCKIIFRTPYGVKLAECVSYLDLVYTKEVNAPGLCKFTLPAGYFVIPLLDDKALVEVWRRNPAAGIDWYCDFYGIYRAQKRTYADSEKFTATTPGLMQVLGWRHVAYFADTADRVLYTTTTVEHIMKSLVTYNCTSAGTVADGRFRLATISYPITLSVEADLGRGTAVDLYACAYKNVLTELQRLAGQYGDSDFDLVKTGDATAEFRYYDGQLGTDRTASVVFALEYGNMANPEYTYDRINEATVIIAGGQGVAAARIIRNTRGPDYDAVKNNIEAFADGRHVATYAGLGDLGLRWADEKRARQSFDYDVIQTASCRYGRDYFLGDLVTATWNDIVVTQQIAGVTVTARDDGSESIGIKTKTRT